MWQAMHSDGGNDNARAYSHAAQTILGFDFGEKRIGVAVGNTITYKAQALTTLHAESNAERLGAVEKLVAEWQPASFVVGPPGHADGRFPDIHRWLSRNDLILQEVLQSLLYEVTP